MGFIINPFIFGGAIGGWKQLGRTTLESAGDTISVGSLADKRYLMYLLDAKPSGVIESGYRMNGDTNNNYSWRQSTDGGADTTDGGTSNINGDAATPSGESFSVGYLANYATKEKLLLNHNASFSTAGATVAPNRMQSVGKHAQTSVAVNALSTQNFEAGNYNTGAELVVLGWDPADTHTDNFWQELASVQGNGTSTILSSGTITAKKYLWIQGFTGDSGGAHNSAFQFNNDTNTNYCTRRSLNGGTDTTWPSESYAQVGTTTNCFFSYFIINNTSNEKICIGHWVQKGTAGAGNAPDRGEFVCKWTNTSNKITEVDLMQQTTSINWGTDVYMKIWGSD